MGSEKGRRPSKWWFWGGVVLWNAYWLALVVVGFCTVVLAGRHWPLPPVFTAPAEFFWFICRPLWELFFPAATETFPTATILSVVLWELGAVVLGLVCYGTVLLVYTIVPGDGPGRDTQRRG